LKFHTTNDIPPLNHKGGELSGLDLTELIMWGSILCQRCGRTRRERVCPHCGYDACLIRLPVQGKYKRIYHDKNGAAFSFSTAFQSLSAINQERKDRKFKIENWLQPSIQQQKFQNKYKTWINQKRIEAEKERFSYETLKLYQSYYKNHYGSLYDMDVRDIRHGDLQLLMNGFASRSEKYNKNLMDCLKTFFKWLNRWEGVPIPIFPEVEITTGETSRALTYEEQMETILRFPEQHRDILYFWRETGLRVSEVCAVQIRDLDLPNARILVQRTYSGYRLVERTKGKNRKWIPLSKTAMEIAGVHSANRFGVDFLFINASTGRGYKPSYLRGLWATHGIKEISLYEAMRHSTISDWAKHATAFQVKDLARHSDIRTSNRYVHNAMTDLRRVVNRDNVIPLQSDSNPIRQNRP